MREHSTCIFSSQAQGYAYQHASYSVQYIPIDINDITCVCNMFWLASLYLMLIHCLGKVKVAINTILYIEISFEITPFLN